MPGITGLFNKYCLTSATANLMTCAPGDNTFDGVFSAVSLVSDVSEFHSIYTTDTTSGKFPLLATHVMNEDIYFYTSVHW